MKYRKKPVIVEAYQTDKEMDIQTLEGTMHASVGDYIITGVNGEQYPCKPDIFAKTYEICGVVKTNADKYFRNATDEEIASRLMMCSCPGSRYRGDYDCYGFDGDCTACWLDWLKQEVSE